jgi:3-deoxy-manno-octulosonate cytidylyltransferase (CMP-KDO synthetase)
VGFHVIIPARYASTRLPGKPLLSIAGKPMIQHVHEHALASGAQQVIIATDDERIREVAYGFGAQVVMTSAEHPSGTDRLAEAVDLLGIGAEEIVVNVQGDEPLMPSALIHQVATNLARHGRASVATLCARITHDAELSDPNVVKVVTSKAGYALYFSRAPIPWERDRFQLARHIPSTWHAHFRHIGLYAYRAGFLAEYVELPRSELEAMECLEQLRVLWHGGLIHVAEAAQMPGQGVDTEEDLRRVERQLMQE